MAVACAAYPVLAPSTLSGQPAPRGVEPRRRLGENILGELNEQIAALLRKHRIVGGSIAIFDRGELVFDHGYGHANLAPPQPVTPQTLFSLASVSKSVTGIGTLLLVEQGRLDLNARVVEVLKDLQPLRGQHIADPRFREITVHQLLFHGGGLIHDAPTVDEQGRGEEFDREDSENRYRLLMTKPLLCDPGTEHHYSNAGFMVLGLVIEHVTGQDYEAFIHEHVLGPMGIQRMHREHGTAYGADETHRFGVEHQPVERSLGNWLATAGAIARFAAEVAGSGGRRPFLSPRMNELMFAMPASLKVQRPRGPHVGLGWDTVVPYPGGRHRFSKNGGKAGVQAWLEHLEYNIDWAVMLNTNSPKDERPKPMGEIRRLALATFERALGIESGG
jgi:N-acyl-D-amino-acid deacylase